LWFLLREKATRRKVSLNRVVVDELTQATVGKWTPDPAFEESVKAQRRIDRSEWG
jgi:hypothetical protein